MTDIFFFQAEDGIRDRNVTGVQTCALPILAWGGLGVAPPSAPRAGRPRWRSARGNRQRRDLGVHRARERERARARAERRAAEIGRASCRERGEDWGGARVLEELGEAAEAQR